LVVVMEEICIIVVVEELLKTVDCIEVDYTEVKDCCRMKAEDCSQMERMNQKESQKPNKTKHEMERTKSKVTQVKKIQLEGLKITEPQVVLQELKRQGAKLQTGQRLH
ncbi:hypothetical protein Tco_0207877, partial [Tanacetum coccineum]